MSLASLSTLFTIILRMSGALAGFVFSIVIAQLLDMNDAGTLFFLISLISAGGLLSTRGYANPLLRYFSAIRARASDEEAFKLARYVFLKVIRAGLFGLFAVMLVAIMLNIFGPLTVIEPRLVSYSAIGIPIFGVIFVTGNLLIAQERTRAAVVVQSLGIPLVYILITSMMVLFDFEIGLSECVLIYLVALILVLMASSAVAWRGELWEEKDIASSSSYAPLDASAKVCFSILLFTTFLQSAGEWLTMFLGNPSDVALFATSNRLVSLMGLFLVAVNMVVAPKIAPLSETKEYLEIKSIQRQTSLILSVIGLPIFVLIFLFPSFFLSFFGAEYGEHTFVVRVLVIGGFVNLATGSCGMILLMSGHERVVHKITARSMLVLVVFALSGFSIFGASGVALGCCAAVIYQNLLTLRKFNMIFSP